MRTFLLVLVLAAGCPRPIPGQPPNTGQRIVKCATDAIQACAPQVLPAVNECLSGSGAVTDCLLGLIKPGTCVTYEVVACLVKHEGDAAARIRGSARDNIVAARAADFIALQGIVFE